MRNALKDFNPSSVSAGTLDVGSNSNSSKLGMINDSAYSLTLTFADGSTDVLPAFYSRLFPLTVPTQKLLWVQRAAMAAVDAPLSIVHSILFDPRDDPSDFPIGPTNRLINEGNKLNLAASANWKYDSKAVSSGGSLFAQIQPPDSSHLAYMTAFHVTFGNQSAAVQIELDLQNIVSDSVNMKYYTYLQAAVNNVPLIVTFPNAIPAWQYGASIIVSSPSLTNGAACINAFGYYTS